MVERGQHDAGVTGEAPMMVDVAVRSNCLGRGPAPPSRMRHALSCVRHGRGYKAASARANAFR